jgi:hypothetical protein
MVANVFGRRFKREIPPVKGDNLLILNAFNISHFNTNKFQKRKMKEKVEVVDGMELSVKG